jgi:ABC-type nickel/cobalt efflux system permease component RcnA
VGAGGHRGRCRYAFSNADPKSNANTNSLACCVRIVRDPNNYTNRNLDVRRYCDSNCYLYADSHSNGHGYCNCHGHQHANSNSDCDRNA